jgi:formylglycine-generating enzyme required for sulfatase activity
VKCTRLGAAALALALLGCGQETWSFGDDAETAVETGAPFLDASAEETGTLDAGEAAPAEANADGGDELPDAASDTPAAPDAVLTVPCPSGGATAMLRVPTNQGSFCIDVTETTGAQYTQFLQSLEGGAGTLPPECSRAPSHQPDGGVKGDQTPVANVNWCDAYAYCAWAGKRLCGQIGGTGNVSAWTSATDDEWYAACSHSGLNRFPYGAAFESQACNGHAHGLLHTVPIASMPACVGGYDGLFDMSGNVWEWEASCTTSSDGLIDPCRARGGGWISDSANLSCVGDSSAQLNFDGGLTRSAVYPFLGIRCCAD